MTVLPGGSTGGLINKMLYGTNAIPLNQGDFDNKRHAATAALTARSKVPSGILIRADDIWRHSKQTIPSHIQQLYTPQATFDRQLGLTIATAFSNHILRAHKKVTRWKYRHPEPPPLKPLDDYDWFDEDKEMCEDTDSDPDMMDIDDGSVLSS